MVGAEAERVVGMWAEALVVREAWGQFAVVASLAVAAAHQKKVRAVAPPKHQVVIRMLAVHLGLGPKVCLVVTDCSSKDS